MFHVRLQICCSCVTLFSHPLVPSGLTNGLANGVMAQFQEMMRQQLETLMYTELEKLLDNTTEAEKEVQITLTHSLCLQMTIWL